MGAQEQQRRFGVTASWLIVWIVVGLLGSRGIADHARQQRLEYEIAAKREVEELKSRDQNELMLLEQNLKRKSREAEARRAAEIDKVWGDPVSAAFKNPAYSLREALQRAADACAPTNSLVNAEVDRFTEFTVTIDTAEAISTNAMSSVARKLLPYSKQYLDALRFSVKGSLVAEVDRQDIAFIDDWSRATDQRIAMLLPRESQSRIKQDPAAIARFQAEQKISEAMRGDETARDKTDRANRKLRQALQDAYAEMQSAVESLHKAVSVNEVRSLKDLDRCEKALTAAVEHTEKARAFWREPVKEWQRLLVAEGVDGDLKEALVNGFPTIFRFNAAKTAKVFEALDGQIESGRFLLKLLVGGGDKWRFTPRGISFLTEDFARQFDRADRQYREDVRELETALRAWIEAVGP